MHEKVQVDGNEPIHHLDSLDNHSVRSIFDLEQSEQKLTFKIASLGKWGLDICHSLNLNHLLALKQPHNFLPTTS